MVSAWDDAPLAAALRESRDRLRLALDAGRLGTWRWDIASGRVEWDERLEAIFGLPPGGFDGRYETYLSLLHPDERAAIRARVEEAVATGTPYLVEHRVVRPDGTVRWVQGRGDVTRDDGGRVTGTIGCVADITEAKLAADEREAALRRLAFLADATALLSESLDLDETLRRLADLAVARLADGALLFTVEGPADVRLAAVRHVDRRRERVLRELHTAYPVRPSHLGMGAALATGRTQLLPEIADDVLAELARDERHLELLRAVGFGTVVAVPLKGRAGVIGLLGLGLDRGRDMAADTLELADELAIRAATAIENARLFEQSRRAASRTQQLQRAASALVAAATVEDVGSVVLSHGRSALGTRGGCLAVVDRPARLLRVVAVEGHDDETVRQWSEIPLDVAGPMAEAVRTCQPSFVHSLEEYASRWPDLAAGTAETPDGSWVHVPLVAGGRAIGVMVWSWAGPRTFDDADERVLLDAFAAQAAAALERAMLYQHTRTIADALQAGLAPPVPPALAGVRVAARYRAAGEGVEVGGDFYDVVPLAPHQASLVVGDVCGRGPDAATLNAQVRFASRALFRTGAAPADVAAAVNANVLADAGENRFCTAVFAAIELGATVRVELVTAGHPRPRHVTAAGRVQPVGPRNPLLGVVEGAGYASQTVELAAGDALVFVTDGVLEARDPSGELFDDERLDALLATVAGQSAGDIAAAVETAIAAFVGTALVDDVAVVVVEAPAGPAPLA